MHCRDNFHHYTHLHVFLCRTIHFSIDHTDDLASWLVDKQSRVHNHWLNLLDSTKYGNNNNRTNKRIIKELWLMYFCNKLNYAKLSDMQLSGRYCIFKMFTPSCIWLYSSFPNKLLSHQCHIDSLPSYMPNDTMKQIVAVDPRLASS